MALTTTCTHVTPACPVSETLYHNYPNLGVNTFFTVLFAVTLTIQPILGTWKRTWSYMTWVSLGIFGELLGYIGRLIMHTNPWNETGLEIQIICLVLAPSFMAAGLYLTLKHVAIHTGRQYSRIRPERYPWIFVGCDLFSILIQAIGGGVAAGGGSSGKDSLADTGDDLIIAGIALQILSMVIFGFFAIDYYLRWRSDSTRLVSEDENQAHGTKETIDSDIRRAAGYRRQSRLMSKFFYYNMAWAYVVIFVRCAYRIHEMAGGWYNSRMRNETLFLLLDGMMIGLAAVSMTVAHPGLVCPAWKI